MSINILTFICGIAVGLCSAFIILTLVNARRRRHYGVPNPAMTGSMVANQELARQQVEQWRRDNSDTVTWYSNQADFEAALRGKRNDEPTELDQ